MSRHQHGYPWPSLATSSYRSSPLAGLQGYISYPHRAAVCMFELVILLLLGHMWGSIRVHHLWSEPPRRAYCLGLYLEVRTVKKDWRARDITMNTKYNTLILIDCDSSIPHMKLMVRLQFWISGKCEVLLHCHDSSANSDSE